MFQIKSLHLKSNRQNCSNRDLNPNCYWDLPITGFESTKLASRVPDQRVNGREWDSVNKPPRCFRWFAYWLPFRSCSAGGGYRGAVRRPAQRQLMWAIRSVRHNKDGCPGAWQQSVVGTCRSKVTDRRPRSFRWIMTSAAQLMTLRRKN